MSDGRRRRSVSGWCMVDLLGATALIHAGTNNNGAMRRTLALVLLCGSCAALPACRGGPLGEMDADLGKHASEERLRRIDRFNLEQFKAKTPTPTGLTAPTELTSKSATETLSTLRERYKAAKSMDLDLAAARVEVLKNNLDLKAAVIDPSIARESLNAERAKFDAVFTPFASFSSNDQPTLPGATGTPNNRLDQTQIGSGVSIPLRTGGRATVQLTESVSDSNSPFDTAGNVYSPSLTFSISQPLLRGAGRAVNVASIVIAGYNAQIVEARTKLTVIGQLASVERAYWGLYAARRELEVRQQQYELATELLNKAELRKQQGVITGVDVTRAQSGVAQRLEGIITAETSLLVQQRELKRIMNIPGLEMTDAVQVKTVTEPAPVDYDLDQRAPELVNLAIAGRMELLESELQVLADSVNIDVAKNGTLPGLDVTASYGVNGIGTNFGAAHSTAAQNRFQSYSVGIQGDIPLTNDAAEARLRRALLTRLQRIATKQSRTQVIQQDVLDAIDRARSAWQRIMAARQSTILAGRTLEQEQRLFNNGARTSTEVLDAAARLADAQSAEIRALSDYQIALVDLSVATGTTLGAADVRWREGDLPTGAPGPVEPEGQTTTKEP